MEATVAHTIQSWENVIAILPTQDGSVPISERIVDCVTNRHLQELRTQLWSTNINVGRESHQGGTRICNNTMNWFGGFVKQETSSLPVDDVVATRSKNS